VDPDAEGDRPADHERRAGDPEAESDVVAFAGASVGGAIDR
jgi:hypothetical protein